MVFLIKVTFETMTYNYLIIITTYNINMVIIVFFK